MSMEFRVPIFFLITVDKKNCNENDHVKSTEHHMTKVIIHYIDTD